MDNTKPDRLALPVSLGCALRDANAKQIIHAAKQQTHFVEAAPGVHGIVFRQSLLHSSHLPRPQQRCLSNCLYAVQSSPAPANSFLNASGEA